jgi:hypothetical protein
LNSPKKKKGWQVPPSHFNPKKPNENNLSLDDYLSKRKENSDN